MHSGCICAGAEVWGRVPEWGDDDPRKKCSARRTNSSIHVPRVGDDPRGHSHFFNGGISIHVPRVGDDGWIGVFLTGSVVFQSTSPAWGTTAKQHKNKTLLSYLRYPFHKILSNANPIFSEFLHSTAKGRHSTVRTSRQMDVHLGFAPANWGKSAQKSWTQMRPAL